MPPSILFIQSFFFSHYYKYFLWEVYTIMSLYEELMKSVITESSTEDYKNRVLREGRFIEKIKDKFTKKPETKKKEKEEKVTDAKFAVQQVTSKDQFKKLYMGEALCKEGLKLDKNDPDSAQKIANFLVNNYGAKQPVHMYWFLGKDVNKLFDLKGDNAYNNDFNFLAIDLNDIPNNYDIYALKSNMGFRYFSDIVDNNEYTEFAAGRHPYSDQIEWLWNAYDQQGRNQRPKTDNKVANNKYGLGVKRY